MNLLFLHTLTIGLDGFDANFWLVRKEDEQLIRRIVIVRHENDEIASGRPLLARFIPELFLELLQCLIQFVLSDEITSIVTQLHYRLSNTP